MHGEMCPIPFGALVSWALEEYRRSHTLFGVYALYTHTTGRTLPLFGGTIETPLGPAAGPHTQLAQNLIAAYAAGSRFFELKTVQRIDGRDLSVAKPCIFAADEGYNVEWSTELTVPQAYEEYVKAWFALKLLSRELGLGSPDGFVFNMSVGYDLEGIQSEKIDRFLCEMQDASSTRIWEECTSWTLENLRRFTKIDKAFLLEMDAHVCRSVTLSTLHGCPSAEIERIATYLITQKGLHTYVKCNPTLLGYAFCRQTLDALGDTDLVFDAHHFEQDLPFADAVPMFHRLRQIAAEHHVSFGLKLSNTFPVQITRGELPGEEMYMSGRSLYPLTLHLVEKMARAFDGELRISYAGGADAFHAEALCAAGVWPITVATTLLKPGGYNRLEPMAETLACLEDLPARIAVDRLSLLCRDALQNPHPRKPAFPCKLSTRAPILDCFLAPCQSGCPIHQEIPAYLALVASGEYAQALRVILRTNPLPFMTGTLCSHRCQRQCTRNFYEESIQIRAAKLLAAQNGLEAVLRDIKPGNPRPENVAIVGGGPCGMAAAFFLARRGAHVTLFEKRDTLGGVVRHIIPSFRIAPEAIDQDVSLLRALGVTLRCGCPVSSGASLLEAGYTHVLYAIGAWAHRALPLQGGQAMDALTFLEAAKDKPETLSLGRHVLVIGGGNTAMDTARVAKRIAGVDTVTLLYRRTLREMPADAEEYALALADGIVCRTLLSPVSLKGNRLLCEQMQLGAPDADGRRSPLPTGSMLELPADTILSAIGETVDADFFTQNGIPLHAGKPRQCRIDAQTFVAGDALHGPSTIVEAIASAAQVVEAILGDAEVFPPIEVPDKPRQRRAVLRYAQSIQSEETRCLGCQQVCENCVDVCPNRANLSIQVPGLRAAQIVHVDKLCNRCGNCAVFCPYHGAPYRDKFTVYESVEALLHSENEGFASLSADEVWVRLEGRVYREHLSQPESPAPIVALMRAICADYPACIG